jgi:hypothetical protein
MKVCGRCKQKLSIDNFRLHKLRGVYRPTSYCKNCHREAAKKLKIKWRNTPEGYLKHLVTHSRSCAKRRGISHSVDFPFIWRLYLKQKGKCAITSVKMTYGNLHKSSLHRVPTHMSLDRINSKLGYSKRNVQLVCNIINRMKQELSMQEFKDWCRLVP